MPRIWSVITSSQQKKYQSLRLKNGTNSSVQGAKGPVTLSLGENVVKMDPNMFMRKLFISTYALEVWKHIHDFDIKHCCACRVKNSNVKCLMLTEDEKIELHFDKALRNVNVVKVIERVMVNMKPIEITIETEAELCSWTETNPALSSEMYHVIKDTVKVIRLY